MTLNASIAAYDAPGEPDHGEYREYVAFHRRPGGHVVASMRNRVGVALSLRMEEDDLRKLAKDILAKVGDE